MATGPLNVPLSKWAFKFTALDQKESVSKNVIDAVLQKFYMDEYLASLYYLTTAVSTMVSVLSLLNNKDFN